MSSRYAKYPKLDLIRGLVESKKVVDEMDEEVWAL